MIKVITVLKSGPDWKSEYVYNFKKGLDKNMSIPFEFICLSDIDLDIPTLPLDLVGAGYWTKLQMFRPEFNLTGECLYFDLDTIICKNIDSIVESFYDYNFLMLQDPYKPEQSGSGMMWWKGDYSHLWHSYLTELPEVWAKKYNQHPRYGDQGFIIDHVDHKQIQEVVPDSKDFCKFTKNKSPDHAKIIIFAGPRRKPWLNLDHPDVIDHWL